MNTFNYKIINSYKTTRYFMLMLGVTRKTTVWSFAAEFTICTHKMSISGLLVLIGFMQTVSTEEAISAVACSSENKIKLVCPNGHLINILSAFYGANDPTICNDNNEDISYCEVERAFSIIKHRCDFKENCTLENFIDLFGDDCDGSTYLEVIYQCLRNHNIMTSITCQFYEFHIECPYGEYITIVRAWYGYQNPSFCTRYTWKNVDKCGSSEVEKVLADKCDHMTICNMMVDEQHLEDPCPSSYKYLKADYVCSSKNLHQHRKIVCDNETMFLNCPKGQVITIKTEFFGKRDPRFCNQPGMDVTNCEAGGIRSYVQEPCQDRQYCFLNDFVNVVGDPCLGVWKYLDVTYECHKDNVKKLIECEDYKLTIDCGSKYIKIANALYGRNDPIICTRKNEYNVFTNHCGNSSSFEIVKTTCDDQHQCTIDVTNNVFGNPCYDTIKYLEVDYMCKSKKK